MSFNKSAIPLSVKLRPSRGLLTLLCALFMGALIIEWCLDIELWLISLLNIATVLTFIWSLALHQWLDLRQVITVSMDCFPQPILELACGADAQWNLRFKDGSEAKASLVSGGCVTPWLTILNFKIQDVPWYRRRRSIVLLPDAVAAEAFRRLRIQMMTQPH